MLTMVFQHLGRGNFGLQPPVHQQVPQLNMVAATPPLIADGKLIFLQYVTETEVLVQDINYTHYSNNRNFLRHVQSAIHADILTGAACLNGAALAHNISDHYITRTNYTKARRLLQCLSINSHPRCILRNSWY